MVHRLHTWKIYYLNRADRTKEWSEDAYGEYHQVRTEMELLDQKIDELDQSDTKRKRLGDKLSKLNIRADVVFEAAVDYEREFVRSVHEVHQVTWGG